jgi:hypothetical protein
MIAPYIEMFGPDREGPKVRAEYILVIVTVESHADYRWFVYQCDNKQPMSCGINCRLRGQAANALDAYGTAKNMMQEFDRERAAGVWE